MGIRRREDLLRHTVEALQGAILQAWEKTITAAQMNALFTTPQILVDAPGPNKVIIPVRVVLEKPEGTAFTVGSAGPLNVGLGNNPANNTFISVALAGFVNQATKQSRLAFYPDPTNATANALLSLIDNVTRIDNLALYLRQATANMSAGTSVLRAHVYGFVLPVDLTFTW
jgi:hypothetical protein